MNNQEIMDFAVSVQRMADQLKHAEAYIKHLERVIKQAVMTNGGVLNVDVTLSDAAFNSSVEIHMGDGKITLIDSDV